MFYRVNLGVLGGVDRVVLASSNDGVAARSVRASHDRSISVSPDSFVTVKQHVVAAERQKGGGKKRICDQMD